MGSSFSTQLLTKNNKLSFDYAEYLRERSELSGILRSIALSSEEHLKKKEGMQVVSAATSVTAGVAGAVALVAAPATFGLSLPVLATTVGIIGNSITAASITSSAVSHSHGFMINKDIVKKLENLQPMIDSISHKDEEVHALITNLQKAEKQQQSSSTTTTTSCSSSCCTSDDKVEDSVLEARIKFDNEISFADEDKAKNSALAAWSILSPGTHWLVRGKKSFESQHEFQEAFVKAADKIDERTKLLENLDRRRFRKIPCLLVERHLSRCRLTCLMDGSGGGKGVMMKVQYFYPRKEQEDVQKTMESDTSNVLLLHEGATRIKVSFVGSGGRTIKKIQRSHPKQPWLKNENNHNIIDVIELDQGDGVDALFYVKGSFANGYYIHKAWDFGRHPSVPKRDWEWWPENDRDQKQLLPDSNERVLQRTKQDAKYDGDGISRKIIGSCGACFGHYSDTVI